MVDRIRNTRNNNWSVCDLRTPSNINNYQGDEIIIINDTYSRTMQPIDWCKLLTIRKDNTKTLYRTLIVNKTIEDNDFTNVLNVNKIKINRLPLRISIIDIDEII